MKNITILGSTGSIGTSSLSVIENNPDKYRVLALSCHKNIELATGQVKKFNPEYICISDKGSAAKFSVPAGCKTKVISGEDELCQIAALAKTDVLVSGLVGTAGLAPTVAAVKAGHTIAIANKEVMVMAGDLVNRLAHKHGATLIPVDSEHSAIFQCLLGNKIDQVEKIIITGSGGPFFRYKGDLHDVTPEQACAHPKWNMGRKISVDSATLMNKALEIIEARWLFDIEPERIGLVIHPQSIVHSLVEYIDASVIAQLGIPDMRIPIQYAFSYPDRLDGKDIKKLDLVSAAKLEFYDVPERQKLAIDLCFEVLKKGHTYPAVLSAANEEAVGLFLQRKIRFTRITTLVNEIINTHNPVQNASVEDIIELDKNIKEQVRSACRQ